MLRFLTFKLLWLFKDHTKIWEVSIFLKKSCIVLFINCSGPEHSSSYTPPGWEEDLEKTVSTLTSASRGLSSAQLELRHTALRLKPNTSLNGGHEQTNLERINETLNEEKNMKNYGEKEERRSVERNGDKTKEKEKEKNGKEKGTDEERRNEIIEEAFSALQRAEEEIKHLRLYLH